MVVTNDRDIKEEDKEAKREGKQATTIISKSSFN